MSRRLAALTARAWLVLQASGLRVPVPPQRVPLASLDERVAEFAKGAGSVLVEAEIFVASPSGLYFSGDNGENWTLFDESKFDAVTISPDKQYVVATTTTEAPTKTVRNPVLYCSYQSPVMVPMIARSTGMQYRRT